MTIAVIFMIGMIGLLTALAYASLRFTTLDPQMPFPQSRWIDFLVALSASLALVATTQEVPAQWRQFFAYLSVALVITPAIMPPYRLTEKEEPSRFRRLVQSRVAGAVGMLPKALLLLLIGALVAMILPLFPVSRPPSWFVVLGSAAIISILTRPISIRLPSGRFKPIERASPGLATQFRTERLIAAGATLLWLVMALPLLEPSYSDEFEVMAFAIALAIALFLS